MGNGRIKDAEINVTGLTGGAGVATGSASFDRNINGTIVYIDVQYTLAPATTDVTISSNVPYNDQILGLANNNARFYGPVGDMVYSNSGAPVPGADVDKPVIRGIPTVAVAQANNDTEVKVIIYYI